LLDRFDALARFVEISRPYLGDGALTGAYGLSERAAARLRLTGEQTVVALAGATGSGKSSLFNALARMELSPTGPLRPTTDEAHACIWGLGDVGELLDYLGVGHTFRRESVLDARDEEPLHGLVLLDLPDMDSISASNRMETDRLVSVVDLVIWVLDPQKYADAAVHEDYLRQMGAVRDVTVVVFNQSDRLSPADVARCHADLVRLVEADGLAGVPVLATSARTGAGVGDVRALLEKAVVGRRTALTRLEGELQDAIASMVPLVEFGEAREPSIWQRGAVDEFEPADVATLGADLARAAGIDAAAAAAAVAYGRRAAIPGRPPWRRRPFEPVPVDPVAVRGALRALGEQAAAGLPLAWAEWAMSVALAETDRVFSALQVAADTVRARRRQAPGWPLIRAVWWLGAAAVLAGLGGWLSSRVSGGGGGSWPLPLAGAGALLVVGLTAVTFPIARRGARRAERRMREDVSQAGLDVAREAIARVRVVRRDHADAATALAAAAG
jgi:energy-coupling factor transporter ATP-binding protein EcfA2